MNQYYMALIARPGRLFLAKCVCHAIVKMLNSIVILMRYEIVEISLRTQKTTIKELMTWNHIISLLLRSAEFGICFFAHCCFHCTVGPGILENVLKPETFCAAFFDSTRTLAIRKHELLYECRKYALWTCIYDSRTTLLVAVTAGGTWTTVIPSFRNRFWPMQSYLYHLRQSASHFPYQFDSKYGFDVW